MVKDSKQSGAADQQATSVLETTTPRVPSFENLPSDEQSAFRLSYDLLRYNLEHLTVSAQAVRDAEAEAEDASRRLLGNGEGVNSVLSTPSGSELSSSSLGRRVQQLADEFRTSRMGSDADQLAATVRLEDLDNHSFTALLEQLFRSGYSVESFVTLFHFVARLLQRAYTERGDAGFRSLCHEMLTAFFIYLLGNVIKFLANIFRTLSQEKKVAAMSFISGLVLATVAFALGIYLMKKKKN